MDNVLQLYENDEPIIDLTEAAVEGLLQLQKNNRFIQIFEVNKKGIQINRCQQNQQTVKSTTLYDYLIQFPEVDQDEYFKISEADENEDLESEISEDSEADASAQVKAQQDDVWQQFDYNRFQTAQADQSDSKPKRNY